MMIVALIAASIASQSAHFPIRHAHNSAAPCHAVPALCMTSEVGGMQPFESSGPGGSDAKMSAYRFDARPCRIIGNMGCPRRARLKLFRLGEPLRDTLLRSFMPR